MTALIGVTSLTSASPAAADGTTQSLVFNVFDYYGAPTGNTAQNDTNAWKACLAAAKSAVGYGSYGTSAKTYPIVTAPGGSFLINDTLEWDVRVSIEGHCEIKSEISEPGKPLWRAVCVDQSDPMYLARHRATSFSHVVSRGNGEGSLGILIAYPDGDGVSGGLKTSQLTFRNTAWIQFGCAVELGDRSYMIGFHSSSIQRNQLGLRSLTGTKDTGERIVFEDCDITGNVEAFVIGKEVGAHFIACSFDQYGTEAQLPYAPSGGATAVDPLIGIVDGGFAVLHACHLEGYVPRASTVGQPDARSRPWFDLTGAFANLSIVDSNFRLKKRPEITGVGREVDGPPFIRFHDDPAKAQRARISGGFFASSDETLGYLGAGGGTLTVQDTSMDASSRFWPHVQRGKGLLYDPVPTASLILDDWKFTSSNASITVVDDGDSKAFELAQTVKESSLAQLFLPIRQNARFRISFEWQAVQAGTVQARIHYGTSKKVIDPTKYADTALAYTNGSWQYASFPQLMRQPAPPWATYAVLSLSLSALPSGGKFRLRNIEASQQ
ncbi:hypothetical protein QFZ52_003062 [Arthrobacter woluwensis]|uniref:hypothetical protein n=1 Tax=Arthrobacter woluwensis TaxID=156980 RepID=UPI0027890A14|nr:hypothetical protein [Arthrobacter woluwensis]MDQ0710410.1 hypothetical protein [Arthrobacter woluwensis]